MIRGPGNGELRRLFEQLEGVLRGLEPPLGLEKLRRALAGKASPGRRARLLVGLGLELVRMAREGRPALLEPARTAFEQGLALLTEGLEPELRGFLLLRLGALYLERGAGLRSDNVDRAVECLESAQEALTRESHPGPWSEIQSHLAIAYGERLRGDRESHLETALHHGHLAEELFERQGKPEERANLQRTLGELYRRRQRGDRRDNLLQAESLLRRALEVKSKDDDPQGWAEASLAREEVSRELAEVGADLDGGETLTRGGELWDGELANVFDREPTGSEALGVLVEGRRRHRPRRVVSTGFAAPPAPALPLPVDEPLRRRTSYLFWLEVGEPVAGAIDRKPWELDVDQLPARAELDVVLFSSPNGWQLTAGADRGRLRLEADGSVRVSQQPLAAGELRADAGLLAKRLFFPLRAPARRGACRLRCNLYHRQQLLQSRVVTAWIETAPPAGRQALEAQLDFTLSHVLSPAALAAMPSYQASLLLNHDGDREHGVRVWAEGGVKIESHLGEGALADLIEQSRGALRKAAWGTEAEWEKQRYRYDGPSDRERLRADLVRLAIRGYRFYTQTLVGLAGDRAEARKLAGRLREPGLVQIVARDTGGAPRPPMLPAALFYDHEGLDTNLVDLEDYRLCEAFLDGLEGARPLEEQECFCGRCPSRGKATTICPSGFWGYRLSLGFPLSVGEGGEVPPAIGGDETLELTVCVSTDPAFTMRPDHERRLQGLVRGLEWHHGDDRAKVLDLLRTTRPHLVYFYCHGGLAESIPYLQVGPRDERPITPDNLFLVYWQEPRPLVFINGCHTTALSPEKALEFVTALVQTSEAAGVVGTEITIFEPLACAFAEACLSRFLVEGLPIGEAVRRARLALLKAGNPLGLVYIPFVQPGLTLTRPPAGG